MRITSGSPYLFSGASKTGSVCRSIALRSQCFAQARGVLPWPPVKRMRLTQGRINDVPENK